jgi:hypothetical protein
MTMTLPASNEIPRRSVTADWRVGVPSGRISVRRGRAESPLWQGIATAPPTAGTHAANAERSLSGGMNG